MIRRVETSGDRTTQIRRIVDDCLRRRAADEVVSDAEIIAAHADLMPELGDDLRILGIIGSAERQADEGGSDSPLGATVCGDRAVRADLIPGYEVIREINRGGQGIVYEGRHTSTNRHVAIKRVRDGAFAHPSDQARLEREVRLLGRLSHPNIVAIHDSGSTVDGFFFVMDYIAGDPLDAYIARHRPSTVQTLVLFAKICEAVNAAHVQGILHRDLKPGNIRVDERGEPHILDFGLAKAVGNGGSSAHTSLVHTATGQFIGSLPWASPEQAAGSPRNLDLRTDVYSLGILLFHMLTGEFPYKVDGNVRDVVDNILRAEPARPSTLRRDVNDEIETLVLKCLAKEPDRRYQTSGELARDVRRYLTGDHIEAKRDSGWYVLRKLVARHRYASAAAALLAVITVSFAGISYAFYRGESRAREDAESLGRRLHAELVAKTQLLEARFAAARGHAFGWFLLAWHQGRTEEARAIADSFVDNSCEFMGAKVLLDARPLVEKENAFREAADDDAFVAYVIGEHHFRDGNATAAREAFRRCLAVCRNAPRKHPRDAGGWLAGRAAARVKELTRHGATAAWVEGP